MKIRELVEKRKSHENYNITCQSCNNVNNSFPSIISGLYLCDTCTHIEVQKAIKLYHSARDYYHGAKKLNNKSQFEKLVNRLAKVFTTASASYMANHIKNGSSCSFVHFLNGFEQRMKKAVSL